MILDKKKFGIELIKATLKITIAGVVLGLLHERHILLAFLLAARTIQVTYNLSFNNGSKNWIIPIGMLFTAISGLIIEYIGVTYNLWEYHNIDPILPYWLPFAWLLSFPFIYKIEKNLIQTLSHKTLKNKLIIIGLISFVFPAFGEMITIALGVWTYYVPYQLFGVPFLAFLVLPLLHICINLALFKICEKSHIADPVFNSSLS